MRKIEIGPNDDNQRLDRFLQKYLEQAPKSLLQKYIRTKKIKVNGARAKADQTIYAGDTLDIYVYEEELTKYERKREHKKVKLTLDVVYEDENILVVDKPKGVLSHAASPEDYGNNVVDWVVDYLIRKGDYVPRIEKSFRPAIVNRLDFNTQGLIICAKNHDTLTTLNEAIAQRKVHKFYLALVEGQLETERAYTGSLEKVSEGVYEVGESADAKTATTIVTPLEIADNTTLVEIELITGRTHQIRVHLSEDGYPIVGDPKYGRRHRGHAKRAASQMLLAYQLNFDEIEGLSYLKEKEIRSNLYEAFVAEAHRIMSDFAD